jgi:hypothetical protein
MTQQLINIGQSANDKRGDPIRTAFSKVNENFTELFQSIGGGRGVVQDLGTGDATLTANQIVGTILTADPGLVDRTLTLPPANAGAGFRLVLINRGTTNSITVQDVSLNIILTAGPQESWELVCDGFVWTVLY